jgi:hypothetical protein
MHCRGINGTVAYLLMEDRREAVPMSIGTNECQVRYLLR